MIDWCGIFAAIGFIVFVLVCSIALTAIVFKLFGRYL